MTRQEFITALRKELKKLPPEEIVEATEFYEEYFDEVLANSDKTEEELIKEMGSPRRVAAQIKADYAARILDEDEAESADSSNSKKRTSAKNKISAVWWVILGICSAPVSIPLALVIGIVVICLVCSTIGIILSIYGTIIGMACAALFVIGMGVAVIVASGAGGLMLFGVGLALAAVAAVAIWGAFIGTRALIKFTVREIREGHEARKKKKLDEMAAQVGEEWTYTRETADPKRGFEWKREKANAASDMRAKGGDEAEARAKGGEQDEEQNK